MLKCGVELASRFTLSKRLGAGALSEIWLAENIRSGAYVALKVFNDSAGSSVDILGLQREFRLSNWVRHPNILRVNEVCRAESFVWTVMDYAAGGNVSQLRGRRWIEILSAILSFSNFHSLCAGLFHLINSVVSLL